MTQLILRARRYPYLWLGLLALALTAASLATDIRAAILRLSNDFVWQVTTGILLLIALAYQWVLLIVRQFKFNTHARAHYLAHRWVGVIATALFAMHAIRLGYGWMSVLTLVFILTALSGLLNKEIVQYKARWQYLVWLWCHITLSIVMVPMIAVHIWVALAYQGF